MSVLIRGLEMPKHCADCEWLQQRFPGGKYWCKRTGELVHETWASANLNPILESCPLVPVPPHGRLGDMDAIARKIRRFGDYVDFTKDEIAGWFENGDFEAIIPAEEE